MNVNQARVQRTHSELLNVFIKTMAENLSFDIDLTAPLDDNLFKDMLQSQPGANQNNVNSTVTIQQIQNNSNSRKKFFFFYNKNKKLMTNIFNCQGLNMQQQQQLQINRQLQLNRQQQQQQQQHLQIQQIKQQLQQSNTANNSVTNSINIVNQQPVKIQQSQQQVK